MNFNFRKIYWLIITLFIFTGCNESLVETAPIDENLVFSTGTNRAEIIEKIALLDGSNDNILDNASCILLTLPLNVQINGETVLIQSISDIQSILDRFLKNPFAQFEVEFEFPILVTTQDYTQITINSEAELNALRSTCIENGSDPDIECIDFQYPIAMATYDRLNQLANVVTINTDEDLFFLLNSFSNDYLLGFEFPLNMVNSLGETVIMNDNSDIFNLIGLEENTCDENDRIYEPDILPQTQTLSLKLTDAPFPLDLVEEVNINITKIDIKTDPENSLVEFITLFEEDITVDMLTLTNGNTLDLSETELPLGSYPSFRMFVNDGFVLMKDGQIFELIVPSGSQSGIKINLREDLVIDPNQPKEVLLDFDVSKSLVARGNINSPNGIRGFNFKPVINAFVLSQSGSLSGIVRDEETGVALSNAQISIIAADTLYTTSFTNTEGSYKVLGITPGNFTITAELKDYQPSTLESIMINERIETNQDITLKRE